MGVCLAHAETLGDVLERQDQSGYLAAIPASQEVTSYAVYQDRDMFLLAYYHTFPKDPNFLEDTLRVLTIDFAARQAAVHEFLLPLELEPFGLTHLGSVLELRKIAGRFYLKGHLTPSASPTLILNPDLTVHDVIPGWVVEVEEGGGVIYRQNSIHFAPSGEPEFFRYSAGSKTSVAVKN